MKRVDVCGSEKERERMLNIIGVSSRENFQSSGSSFSSS